MESGDVDILHKDIKNKTRYHKLIGENIMKGIVFGLMTILTLSVLVGCASFMQTAKVQEVIRKPKNYCELKQAEKLEITMRDVPIYDDSPCYIGKGDGIKLGSQIPGKRNTFWGELTNPWGNSGHIVIMPYASKASVSYTAIPEDICLLKGDNGYRKFEYEMYFGKEEEVIRFVKKRKLTSTERQIWLQKANELIEQDYQQAQRDNEKEYEDCTADYDKIVNHWQTSTSIKKFCGDIKYAYTSRYCLNTKDDNDKCKTLANLLWDCYKQERSTEDVYISAFGQFR